MKNNTGKTLVSGLLLGALIGTAYSMLFAQKKGSQLRRELKEKSASPKAVVDAVVREYGKAGKETSAVVKEFLASEQAQDAITEFKDAFGPLVARLERRGQALSDVVRATLQERIGAMKKSATKKVFPRGSGKKRAQNNDE